MKSNTLKFIGYYLTPFVLHSIGVFAMWNAKSEIAVYITMAVTVLFNMLWVWFHPNESALPTALMVVASGIYAWAFLLCYTLSVWVIVGFGVFGFWCGIVEFVWAFIIGNRYMRFNNGKRRYDWKTGDTKAGLTILLVCILVISLCLPVAIRHIKDPPTTYNEEVWVDYFEDEQMSKG